MLDLLYMINKTNWRHRVNCGQCVKDVGHVKHGKYDEYCRSVELGKCAGYV